MYFLYTTNLKVEWLDLSIVVRGIHFSLFYFIYFLWFLWLPRSHDFSQENTYLHNIADCTSAEEKHFLFFFRNLVVDAVALTLKAIDDIIHNTQSNME